MAYLTDGHQTWVTFANFPSVLFKEKTVTPPGLDGGEKNDITTMRNETVTTHAPQRLFTMTDFTMVASYDPAVLDDIVSMINVNQLITIKHSDDSEWEFWGFLQKFMPGENKKGEQPTATITVCPTNYDDSEAEVVPDYNAA